MIKICNKLLKKVRKFVNLKHFIDPATASNSTEANVPISTVQLQPVKLYNMEKIRNRKKQEEHLTMTVGVIFLVYMVCNIPASVVLLLDPDATKYIEVNSSAVSCS